jgi:hypothetical protein
MEKQNWYSREFYRPFSPLPPSTQCVSCTVISPQAFIADGETEAHYRYYPKNTNPNLTWGSATATPKTLTLT